MERGGKTVQYRSKRRVNILVHCTVPYRYVRDEGISKNISLLGLFIDKLDTTGIEKIAGK